MKRKTSKKPTLIYSYGAREPEQQTWTRDLLYAAGTYYNHLVEISRQATEEYRAIRRRYCPELDAMEQQHDEMVAERDALNEEYKRRRGKAGADAGGKRVKRVRYPDLDERLAEIKAKLKPLSERMKSERARFKMLLKPGNDELKARFNACCERGAKIGKNGPGNKAEYRTLVVEEMLSESQWPEAWRDIARNDFKRLRLAKAARARATEDHQETDRHGNTRTIAAIKHGTYSLVEKAIEQASEDPAGPAFRRFSGEGRIGIQLTENKGLTVPELLACESTKLRLQIHPHRGKGKPESARTQTRQYGTLWLRAGSDENLDPIWIKIPMLLHRPLPEGAIIKWCWLHARRRGSGTEWRVQFSIEVEPRRRTADSDDVVALHLAWRKMGDRIRAGYLVRSDGQSEEIVLPAYIADGFARAEARRGYGDNHFDYVRKTLKTWQEDVGGAPGWLVEAIMHMDKWRAHWKLARVARRWAEETLGAARIAELWQRWKKLRLDGTPRVDLFALPGEIDAWACAQGIEDGAARMALYLEWWRRKDQHLKAIENSARSHAENRRKYERQVLAKCWSERVQRLIVDDMRLDQLARRAKPSEKDQQHDAARRQRQMVAPGELRELFKLAFGKVDTIEVSSEGLASTCAECGGAFNADLEDAIGVCENGHRMDRDENAARNMLTRALGGERRSGATIRVGARARPTAVECR